MAVVLVLEEEEEDCLGQTIIVIVSWFDWLLEVVVVVEEVVAWETTASLGILDILLLLCRITDYCLPYSTTNAMIPSETSGWDVKKKCMVWVWVRQKVYKFSMVIFFLKMWLLRGAEEACWAHNPKVLGSKPSGATSFCYVLFVSMFVCCCD